MSESAVEAKVAYLLKMIEHINIVLERHKGVDNALEDEAEARAAIMMSLNHSHSMFALRAFYLCILVSWYSLVSIVPDGNA